MSVDDIDRLLDDLEEATVARNDAARDSPDILLATPQVEKDIFADFALKAAADDDPDEDMADVISISQPQRPSKLAPSFSFTLADVDVNMEEFESFLSGGKEGGDFYAAMEEDGRGGGGGHCSSSDSGLSGSSDSGFSNNRGGGGMGGGSGPSSMETSVTSSNEDSAPPIKRPLSLTLEGSSFGQNLQQQEEDGGSSVCSMVTPTNSATAFVSTTEDSSSCSTIGSSYQQMQIAPRPNSLVLSAPSGEAETPSAAVAVVAEKVEKEPMLPQIVPSLPLPEAMRQRSPSSLSQQSVQSSELLLPAGVSSNASLSSTPSYSLSSATAEYDEGDLLMMMDAPRPPQSQQAVDSSDSAATTVVLSDLEEDSPPPPYDLPSNQQPAATIDESLGVVKPTWLPDSEAAACMICSTPFSFITRRHHCRACGKIYCDTCCHQKYLLQYSGQAERVCVTCFPELVRLSSRSLLDPSASRPSVTPAILKRGRSSNSIRKKVAFPADLNEEKGTETESPTTSEAAVETLIDISSSDVPDSPPSFADLSYNPETSVEFNWSAFPHLLYDNTMRWLAISIDRFIHVRVKCRHLPCCYSSQRLIWIIQTVGLEPILPQQQELCFIIDNDLREFPFFVLNLIKSIGDDLSQGGSVPILDGSFVSLKIEEGVTAEMTGEEGFIFTKRTFQCTENVFEDSMAPELQPSILFGVFVKGGETAFARQLPLRVLTRLGFEYKHYPCPLISRIYREPLYATGPVGHTILAVLCDLVGFEYDIAHVRGASLLLDGGLESTLSLPAASFDSLQLAMNRSQSVIALRLDLSEANGSHLTAIQRRNGEEGEAAGNIPGSAIYYATEAIAASSAPPLPTPDSPMADAPQLASSIGVSFVVFNSSYKPIPGSETKSKLSLIEDGIMVSMEAALFEQLRSSLINKLDFTFATTSFNQPGGGVGQMATFNVQFQASSSIDEYVSLVDCARIVLPQQPQLIRFSNLISKTTLSQQQGLSYVYQCGWCRALQMPANWRRHIYRLIDAFVDKFSRGVGQRIGFFFVNERALFASLAMRVSVTSTDVSYAIGLGGKDLRSSSLPTTGDDVSPMADEQPVSQLLFGELDGVLLPLIEHLLNKYSSLELVLEFPIYVYRTFTNATS